MRTRSGAVSSSTVKLSKNLLLTRRILERVFSLLKVSRCRGGFREWSERVAQEAGFVADLFYRLRDIFREHWTVDKPNEIHQADLLFLPHDTVRRKTFKYALVVVDVASRYKDAETVNFKRIFRGCEIFWENIFPEIEVACEDNYRSWQRIHGTRGQAWWRDIMLLFSEVKLGITELRLLLRERIEL